MKKIELLADNKRLRQRNGEMMKEIAKLRWELKIPSDQPVSGHPDDGWSGGGPAVFEPHPGNGPVNWLSNGRINRPPTVENLQAQLADVEAQVKKLKVKGKK